MADRDHGRLEADFETMIADDDDTAARIMLAAGIPIHVVRAETPTGYVVRVHPMAVRKSSPSIATPPRRSSAADHATATNRHRIEGRINQHGAGDAAIRRRNQLLAVDTDCAFETTLTGSSTLRLVAAAKDRGYNVTLVYVRLATVDLSIRRVLGRVLQGGHAVPARALERRFRTACRS